MSDEKNLFKVCPLGNLSKHVSVQYLQLEQDFEIASSEYEYINNALKQDLPRFMQLGTHFIDPLFNSFFYMQCVSDWHLPICSNH